MPKTSPERIAAIKAAWAEEGATARSVCRKLDSSFATVAKYRPLAPLGLHDAGPPAVPREALHEMATAAQARDEYEEPVEEMWARAEKAGQRAISKAKVYHDFTWTAPGRHLLLVAISDMHIAPGTVIDFKRMRDDAILIRDTPNCYAILGGDQVDNHIKHRSAILSARSQPSDQYRLFEYYLQLLGPKCILGISGNHDAWTNETAGVDVMGRIFRDKRVFYAPDEAFLNLRVGSQEYLVALRHQYRFNSGFNQTHAVKQWLRMGNRDFDIGIVAHHHEAALEQFIWRDKFRWAARPGSYQITTSYSRMYGFNHAIPTCPTFLLAGDRREISGFKSLESMIHCTDAINQLRRAA